LPDSKTNMPRTIHLSDDAVEVLKTVPRVGRYVIAGTKADQPYKNLGRAWIVARAYKGLQDCRLHDLRHSFASLAAGCGILLQMIGKLLGHRVAATTMRYAHLTHDQVASINDELGVVMQAAIENRPARDAANVVKLKQPRKPRAIMREVVTPPPTRSMLLLGFAGIGFMAYRRKAKPALTAA
jgi:hypothetical protein